MTHKRNKIELKGYKSVVAFVTYNKILFGLSLSKMFMDYREFYKQFNQEDKLEENLKEALSLVPLDQDEILSLLCFFSDTNGIPYSKESLGSLSLKEINEMMLEVLKEIASLEVFF